MAKPDHRTADLAERRQRALSLIDAGKHDRAADACLELSNLDGVWGGDWARRAADCYRRMNKKSEQLGAMSHAADLYQRHGALVKAIAMCKAILELDASNTATLERLTRLHAERSIPPPRPLLGHARSQPRPPMRPVPAAAASAAPTPPPDPRSPIPPPPPVAKAPRSAPLHSLPLSSLVPGSKRTQLTERSEDEVYEIPLDGLESAGPTSLAIPEPASEDRDASEVLPKTPLFSELGAASLERLIHGMELMAFDAGDIICRQGDPATSLFVIADGSVEVYLDGTPPIALSELADGDFFGEAALIADQPRTANVRARAKTTLLGFDEAVLRALIDEEPSVLTVVLRFLRERLLAQLVARVPLFESFAGQHLYSLAPRFQLVEIPKGAAIIEQGRAVKGLFVIMSGTAHATSVEASTEDILGTLGPGDLCGEMSLLSGRPAIASVVASTKCLALLLPAKDFREGIMVQPRFLELVSNLADERSERNSAIAARRRAYEETRLPLV